MMIMLYCSCCSAGAQVAENDTTRQPQSKKIEPYEANQKWCDGIEIINDSLIFKNTNVNGNGGDVYVNIRSFLHEYVLDGATTENIKWQETKIIDGKKLAFFEIETKDNSVLVTSNLEFGTGNSAWGKAIFARDDTKIFPHDSAKYISSDGTVIAATSTTILIIPPGKTGRLTRLTLSQLVGSDSPQMQKPEIFELSGWYVIKDPVMKNSKGEQMIVIFRLLPEQDKFESGVILDKTPLEIR
jgi:hypothetical protein